jgi:hypothetical protein
MTTELDEYIEKFNDSSLESIDEEIEKLKKIYKDANNLKTEISSIHINVELLEKNKEKLQKYENLIGNCSDEVEKNIRDTTVKCNDMKSIKYLTIEQKYEKDNLESMRKNLEKKRYEILEDAKNIHGETFNLIHVKELNQNLKELNQNLIGDLYIRALQILDYKLKKEKQLENIFSEHKNLKHIENKIIKLYEKKLKV